MVRDRRSPLGPRLRVWYDLATTTFYAARPGGAAVAIATVATMRGYDLDADPDGTWTLTYLDGTTITQLRTHDTGDTWS
jgi:hypothetical protein